MSPAQLARLNAARRLQNSATVAIVLDEYAALIPTLRAADSVPALQGEIAHIRSALAAQVAATEAERAAAAKAKEHADAVRKGLQAGKATAESRALRAEAALSEAQATAKAQAHMIAKLQATVTDTDDLRKQIAVRDSKVADQAKQIRSLMEIRRQRSKGTECERDDCHDLQYARGLCIRHYQQERRAAASGICPKCGKIRAVGRSGRCRSCYLSAVTTLGRDAARCSHV
jgi:hypothetical protein